LGGVYERIKPGSRLTMQKTKSRKPSVVKERPSQLVRVVDLTDIVTAAADSSRLQKLADAMVDTGPHVWTLSATPTMEEVKTAKEARLLL
jgi:hypothetical protein